MSGGYGKLFASMYDGTLYGRWQALVTFQQLIILCDAHGVVDMTPHAIAARTSIPLEIIMQGIEELEKPDPYSRTPDEQGRRIERLDDHRPWGWRIINYSKYREMLSLEQKRKADRDRIAAKRAATELAEARDNPDLFAKPSEDPRHVAGNGALSQSVADVAHAEASASASASASAEAEASKNGSQKLSMSGKPDRVGEVFDHWKAIWNHPRAGLDAKRRAAINRALKIYLPEQLMTAISGYRNSPHHTGQNDRNTVYDDIGLLLRDAAHIDAGIRFAEAPPDLTSPLTQHNVAVLSNWKAPEDDHATDRRSEIPRNTRQLR